MEPTRRMIKSISSCISVSSKGEQFLSSARPDYQPPLVLPVTSEMADDEEHKSTLGEVEDFKSLATLERDGFSEVGNWVLYCCSFTSISSLFSSYVIYYCIVESATNKYRCQKIVFSLAQWRVFGMQWPNCSRTWFDTVLSSLIAFLCFLLCHETGSIGSGFICHVRECVCVC